MLELWQLVEAAARGDTSVLIRGETGAGKEVVARQVHRLSPRRGGPFVAINCGAIPADLLESELFGHRKGAFTGAISDYSGQLLAANGGTLFLDEIGDMPRALQVKLLRVLLERDRRAQHGDDAGGAGGSHEGEREQFRRRAVDQHRGGGGVPRGRGHRAG